MAIITISRESYSWGNTIAEKAAAELGYSTMNREALIDASKLFNIPEIKLAKAIHDAPSILERFTYGKERYMSYINAALLKHVQKDNIVYHGLAGHFFMKGISHVLKVRIIADFEDRVNNEMARENIPREQAVQQLKKDDLERVRWSQSLYGIDTHDSSLYDLIIHIKSLTVDDAVELICTAARLKQFQATEESQKMLNDLVVAATVKAEVVEKIPHGIVTCTSGDILIQVKDQPDITDKLVEDIEKTAKGIDGVRSVNVEIKPVKYRD
jgi:cytidylate kinase